MDREPSRLPSGPPRPLGASRPRNSPGRFGNFLRVLREQRSDLRFRLYVTTIELKARHAPYVKLAARIFLKSGMTPRAKEYYNELLRLGGSDATVRQALEAKGALGPKKASMEAKKPEKSGFFGKRW